METPTDVPSIAHLHSLSVDLAAAFLSISDTPTSFPWHKIRLPAYSALRVRSGAFHNQQQPQPDDNLQQQQQQQPCSSFSDADIQFIDPFPDGGSTVPHLNLSHHSSSSFQQHYQQALLALPPPPLHSTRNQRRLALREYRQQQQQQMEEFETNLNQQEKMDQNNDNKPIEKNENITSNPTTNITSSSLSSSSTTTTTSTTPTSTLSDTADFYDKKGMLRKRGRKTGMLKKRYFALRGGILYNFHKEKDYTASWKLSLAGAHVGTHANTCRIVLLMDRHRRIVLYAKDERDMNIWADAFEKAAEMDCTNDKDIKQVDSQIMEERQEEKNVEDITNSNVSDDVWDSFTSFATLKINRQQQQRQKSRIKLNHRSSSDSGSRKRIHRSNTMSCSRGVVA